MKNSILFLILLMGLASCRATMEQKVYQTIHSRTKDAPVLVLLPEHIMPDSAAVVASLNLSVVNMGCDYQDAAKALIVHSRELGGDVVQINRMKWNLFVGGLDKVEAMVYHTGRIEQNPTLLKKIKNYEQSLEPSKPYSPKFEISADIGYSYDYTSRKGLSGSALDLYNGLSHGIITQIHANLLLSKSQGIGVMYNGLSADYLLGEGVKALRHNNYYGINWHAKGHVSKNIILSSDVGIGFSTHSIFAKMNNISIKTDASNGAGIHIGIGCDYRIIKSLGIGAKVGLLTQSFSYSDSLNEYGGITRIHDNFGINRVNISLGIRYYIGESNSKITPRIINK